MNKGWQDRSREEWIQKRLQVLQDMPGVERSPEAEKAGQARFLSEATALRKAALARSVYPRQGRWGSLRSFISGKQARLAFYTATALCVVLGLMLASGGTVVYASLGSQPGQVLYPVKLISENVRLELASTPKRSSFEHGIRRPPPG